jgi:Protein of unknown function (DUF1565)
MATPFAYTYNTVGISGSSGYSGFSGSGVSGYTGYSGTSGYTGYSGTTGYSGYSGFTGYSGYSGKSGYSSYSGYTGISGYSGRSGFTGYSGYTGISGYSGIGLSGYSGINGSSVTIIGTIPNVYVTPPNDPQATLNAAFPSATNGNGVIDETLGHLWVYGSGVWTDVGQVKGDSGTSGYSGVNGYSGYSGTSGAFAGSGTSGYIPVFTGLNSLVASTIVDNGTTATATGFLSAVSGFTYDTVDIANRLYVSENGNDSNNGLNPTQPLATIKKAVAIAAANTSSKYTIFLGSGAFRENNPIYLPTNTSIIGDNLKRCSIIPINRQYDILWCNPGCYVWGVTFREHLAPGAACAFPVLSASDPQYAIAFNTAGYEITAPTVKPFSTTSPYIQGSSSITSASAGIAAGAGLRIDGSLVRGYLRSFVIDSYTQYNQGGQGIHILNNGYAQLVSTFTICCTEGIRADSGGTCSINTSNCSFGLSGIVADGYSTSPVLTATLASAVFVNNNIISVTNATPRPPDQYDCPVDNPYVGLVFTIDGDPSDTLYTIDSVALTDGVNYGYDIVTVNNAVVYLSAGALIKFYIRSTVTTSAHTMEYVGSGTEITSAIPALGGVGNPNNEAVATNGGAVYYTSTNQLGNFKVGSGFTIVQSTGTIQGDVFNKSILSLVTPLTLALE